MNFNAPIVHFDSAVFAGGGNRCFWQAGFWSVAAAALDLRPSVVAAVSAGSAVACALFASTFDHGFEKHLRAVASNRRNMYLRNLLRTQPVFPHGAMYRDAILTSIDRDALLRLHGAALRSRFSLPARRAGRRDDWRCYWGPLHSVRMYGMVIACNARRLVALASSRFMYQCANALHQRRWPISSSRPPVCLP